MLMSDPDLAADVWLMIPQNRFALISTLWSFDTRIIQITLEYDVINHVINVIMASRLQVSLMLSLKLLMEDSVMFMGKSRRDPPDMVP